MDIKELKQKITEANEAYRAGNPIMSDPEYDNLIDQLRLSSPDDELLAKVGTIQENDSRKKKLPYTMGSMEKIKTIDEYQSWLKKKHIPVDTKLVITPKYDGISLTVGEWANSAWTRGDGTYGVFIPEHFSHIRSKMTKGKNSLNIHSYGELIMKKSVFHEKYSSQYENPRNLVAGKVNEKIPSVDILSDLHYIRYGIHDERVAKSEQLITLNKLLNDTQVQFEIIKANQITEELLLSLYEKWSIDYEIDGLIIEIDDVHIRESIGMETNSNNPGYARAYKGSFEEIGETTVVDIKWQISKQRFMKPVIVTEPVRLNGATVTNFFGDNARFVNSYGIRPGAKLKVKRSGAVIPRIIEVNGIKVEKDKFPIISDELIQSHCSHCPSEIVWNDNNVEIMCSNVDCDGSQIQRNIAFFELMGVENVSDGTIEEFWERGYKTIKDILNLSITDLMSWNGWEKKKAEKVLLSIHSKMNNVPLERIQHASGFFFGMGSDKLGAINREKNNKTKEDILKIKGIAKKTADIYFLGIQKFWDWMVGLPITISSEEKLEVSGDKCKGWAVCFTGFRDKKLEQIIVSQGGEIKSGVSSKTTHLVMEQIGSGSTKEQNAKKLGIKIMSRMELESLFPDLSTSNKTTIKNDFSLDF